MHSQSIATSLYNKNKLYKILTGNFNKGRLTLDVSSSTPRVTLTLKFFLAEKLFDHISGDVCVRLHDSNTSLRVDKLGLNTFNVLGAVAFEVETEGVCRPAL